MRQQSGAELSFVSLSNLAESTIVTIDGSNLSLLGDYELVLESFDEANTVQSTLKKDRIQISVESAVSYDEIAFIEPLALIQVICKTTEPMSWDYSLPAINDLNDDPV